MNNDNTTITTVRERLESPEVAARYIGINRRRLLELARRGIRGAYALERNRQRKSWVFRLSELDEAITGHSNIGSGSSR